MSRLMDNIKTYNIYKQRLKMKTINMQLSVTVLSQGTTLLIDF